MTIFAKIEMLHFAMSLYWRLGSLAQIGFKTVGGGSKYFSMDSEALNWLNYLTLYASASVQGVNIFVRCLKKQSLID